MDLTATKQPGNATLLALGLNDQLLAYAQTPTSLPVGRYQLVLAYSPLAQQVTALVLGVRGYSMKPLWFDPLGTSTDASAVPLSLVPSMPLVPARIAFNVLLEQLQQVGSEEPLWLVIS